MNKKHAEKSSPGSMGRPRGFDRDHALQIALQLFWRHGYEGVSIADLTQAIGIAPPSLYAAFGSKAELYREVIELYQRRPTGGAIATFQQDGPIAERLRDLLLHAVRAATDPAYPKGCMLTAGLLYCGAEHSDLADTVSHLRRARSSAITDRLQRAIDHGELPQQPSAAAMARYVSAVMQGISIQARDGATADELNEIVDLALRNWPGGPPVSASGSRAVPAHP
jgi:AcrR family transcriptional regulator